MTTKLPEVQQASRERDYERMAAIEFPLWEFSGRLILEVAGEPPLTLELGRNAVPFPVFLNELARRMDSQPEYDGKAAFHLLERAASDSLLTAYEAIENPAGYYAGLRPETFWAEDGQGNQWRVYKQFMLYAGPVNLESESCAWRWECHSGAGLIAADRAEDWNAARIAAEDYARLALNRQHQALDPEDYED